MKKLFNIFKLFQKKACTSTEVNKSSGVNSMICVNGKNYVVQDEQYQKIQSNPIDVNISGYCIEERYLSTNPFHSRKDGHMSKWYNHSNKIYSSKLIAVKALMGISKSTSGDEYRIVALYKMNEMEYRNFKITEILSNYPKKEHEIKYWKLKDDFTHTWGTNNNSRKFKKGSIFIQLTNGEVIISATPSEGVVHIGHFFKKIPKEILEEIDILNEKKIHPHLIKSLKLKIKNDIDN